MTHFHYDFTQQIVDFSDILRKISMDVQIAPEMCVLSSQFVYNHPTMDEFTH